MIPVAYLNKNESEIKHTIYNYFNIHDLAAW